MGINIRVNLKIKEKKIKKNIKRVDLEIMKEQKGKMYKRADETKNIVQFDGNGYPFCEKHGAMICVSETRKLWRCIACGIGVSFGSIESFDRWLEAHKNK